MWDWAGQRELWALKLKSVISVICEPCVWWLTASFKHFHIGAASLIIIAALVLKFWWLFIYSQIMTWIWWQAIFYWSTYKFVGQKFENWFLMKLIGNLLCNVLQKCSTFIVLDTTFKNLLQSKLLTICHWNNHINVQVGYNTRLKWICTLYNYITFLI